MKSVCCMYKNLLPFAIALYIIFIFVLVYKLNTLPNNSKDSKEYLNPNLRQSEYNKNHEAKKSRFSEKENNKIEDENKTTKNRQGTYNIGSNQPPTTVEKLRRKLLNDVRELWYFTNFHIKGRYNKQEKRKLGEILEIILEYNRTISKDLTSIHKATKEETWSEKNSTLLILRTLTNRIVDLFIYLHVELTKIIQGNGTETKESIKDIGNTFSHKHGLVKLALQDLENDTDTVFHWRYKKSLELGQIIHRKINEIQHPADCSSARKLLCGGHQIFGHRGFGCQLHEVVLCLMAAFGSGRTLILDSKGWSYAKDGWETVFRSVNGNCTVSSNDVAESHSKLFDINTKVVKLPGIIATLHPRPDFFPRGIPAEISRRLHSFHSYPPVWWIGQFVAYLIRPNDEMTEEIVGFKQRQHIKSPIVGFHVRRTDKVGDEAGYHSIDEYMVYAEDWFDTYELQHPGTQRRVYIASDDPTVVEEARSRYPRYQFIHERNISQSANLKTRETLTALRGLLIDIYTLVSCDFIVCTFSSRICRVVYELRQTLHGDAAQQIQSLDDIYFYSGQPARFVRALENNIPRRSEEISFEIGDEVLIRGNHWDGYSLGLNTRTKKEGLYPSYKVEDVYSEGHVSILRDVNS